MPNNTTLFVTLLASGLAVALSRENRIRRAFQMLAARLLEKLRQHDRPASKHPHNTARRHP